MDVEISYQTINGRQIAFVKYSGVMTIVSLLQDTPEKLKISQSFDGNIIIDVRDTEDRLKNKDANQVIQKVIENRCILRKNCDIKGGR
jgi:hypothetical protein